MSCDIIVSEPDQQSVYFTFILLPWRRWSPDCGPGLHSSKWDGLVCHLAHVGPLNRRPGGQMWPFSSLILDLWSLSAGSSADDQLMISWWSVVSADQQNSLVFLLLTLLTLFQQREYMWTSGWQPPPEIIKVHCLFFVHYFFWNLLNTFTSSRGQIQRAVV